MQDPNILLTMLSKMAQKPEVRFDKLFQKLYNTDLWLMAYERIAANPGSMTPGNRKDNTADGMGMERINRLITELKASRYKPNPARRTYVPKADGRQRPIGIPDFDEKLVQTVIRLILEAIYEPQFSDASHGFRPNRSCHTALQEVKKMNGTRWWIEADVRGFFDNLSHQTLLRILRKRITDNRFLHLIEQFLRAGYVEDWQYQHTYSGVPQGGNLSPILSNIYLNELDQQMAVKIAEFKIGKRRKETPEYQRICRKRRRVKVQAKATGDWSTFDRLTKQMLDTPASDAQDPDYKRMYYCRYADDWLIGIIGSKADAVEVKQWLADYLREELQLELSAEKTVITHVDKRARFLGYDIKRWAGERRKRVRTPYGVVLKRTCTQHIALLMPRDRVARFAKKYGRVQNWQGYSRDKLLHLSELEILMTFNAEIRGFINYYALASNLTSVGANLLWLTTSSFLRTLADKHRTSLKKEARRLKQGASRYVISIKKGNGTTREYILLSSTKYFERKQITYEHIDQEPNIWKFQSRSELGQRLRAHQCEWCGTRNPPIEVHHIRKLKDVKGKKVWERQMIARRRKTMVLCKQCHVDLHAGRLTEANRAKGKLESRIR